MSPMPEWSAEDRLSRPTSSKPVSATPSVTMRLDGLGLALAHGAGDHPGLAEAAAAGAAAEDLDREALVHGLGQRHDLLLGVLELLEVLDGALGHAGRHARLDGDGLLQAAVVVVAGLVERRDVDALDVGQGAQQGAAVRVAPPRRDVAA